jgi:DNA-binding MarR family transcriptional regulator
MPTDVTAACKLVATDLHTIQHLADRRDAGARMRGYRMAPTDHDVATLFRCHTQIQESMRLLPDGFDSGFCAALGFPPVVNIGGVSGLTYHSLCAELGRGYLARWGHLPALPIAGAVLACEIVHELCAVVSVDRVTPDGFDPGAVLADLEREGLALSVARPPADDAVAGMASLHPAQAKALRRLGKSMELVLIQDLADAVGCDRKTMNKHLGRLKASGLVAAPDGPNGGVGLTSKGQNVLRQLPIPQAK